MRFFLMVAMISMTVMCWGTYGPVLHEGQDGMNHSLLLPFLFVGVAYFFIAVAAPVTILSTYGEEGAWTVTGTFWSLLAGGVAVGGALGIIIAFSNHGRSVYVMPLVFGGAPIVNSFVTIGMSRSVKKIGPVFLAGLLIVVLGAVTVMLFKPTAASGSAAAIEPTFWEWIWVLASIGLTTVCWGMYGPVLHKGQMKMSGSRLRPLICVGLAYFVIAVAVPAMMLSAGSEQGWGGFTWGGSMWSLAAGAVGAVGALGVIMAFNFGGNPVYVMPLIFGGAPVVNTFASMTAAKIKGHAMGEIHPVFYAGMILVAAGAVLVLVFAPRGEPHAPSPSKSQGDASTDSPSEPESAPANSHSPSSEAGEGS